MVDKRNTLGLGGYMPKRNAYERRGNNNERTVREKAGANKPITRREMRAAFEAWQAGRAEEKTSAHKDSVEGMAKQGRHNPLIDSDSHKVKDSL
jgi:hypothetical protein